MRMVRSIVLAVLLTVAGALAATAAEQQAAAPATGAGNRPAGAAAPSPQQFSEMKSRMLKMIDDRRKQLDEQKACVKGAKNMEDLRKCRAERMMRPERQMRHEGRRPGDRERRQGGQQNSTTSK